MAIGDNYYKSSDYSWGVDIDSDADLVVEGNVGIGTVNPQAKLDIKGSINFNGQKYCYCIFHYSPINDWVAFSPIVPATWTADDCDKLCMYASNYPVDSNDMYTQVYCVWDHTVAGGRKFSGTIYKHRYYGTHEDTWPNGFPNPNCGW